MTRKIENLNGETFKKIVEQLRPWNKEEWSEWQQFVVKNYNIRSDEMSENHFFLYIIPKVIQLHGYGDPLLDKNMQKHIQNLSNKGLESCFSEAWKPTAFGGGDVLMAMP